MRYGLELPNGGAGADVRLLADLARRAEQAGWDGVFVEDHLIHHASGAMTPTCDTWVALAAIAIATSRVRIGPAVTPLPRRRAWTLARQAVTIDHLSDGRLTLGVGLGGDRYEAGYAAVGEETDLRVRAQMLDESLEVLAGLWTGEPFSFTGRHLRVRDAVFRPAPVQRPRIPIWVGGAWPRRGPSERAARWDGFLPLKDHGPDEPWLHGPEAVRAICEFVTERRGSLAGYDIALGGADRGEDWEAERATIAALAEAGATWWMEYVPSADPDSMRAAVDRGPLVASQRRAARAP